MAGGYEAFVEILPDFSKLKNTAGSELKNILGPAGTTAGAGVGGGIVGGIKGFAGPILAAVAALGIASAVGNAIGAGISYGIDSVRLASDLSETKSAIGQVFGSAAADIDSFASTAAKKLGQTQQQALTAAQTFGVFAKSAGLTDKPLANFSTGLVTLSGDLASFYNSSPQEAIDAISAGLRGESEPLRRYGVLLDDATLKQRAVTLGIYDGTGALSQQQRILSAQAEIFAQTGIAQGDFEKTSGGLANQQRILAASLEDTQTKLGEALLPTFNKVVTFANEQLLPKFNEFIEAVGPRISEALEKAGPKFEELAKKAGPLVDELTNMAIDAIPQITSGLSDFVDTVPAAIDFFQQLADGAKSVGDGLDSAAQAGPEFTNFLQDLNIDNGDAGLFDDIFGIGQLKDNFKLYQGLMDGEIDELGNHLLGKFAEAGGLIPVGFADGIERSSGLSQATASRMAQAAVDAAKPVVAADAVGGPRYIGSMLVDGVIGGIDSKTAQLSSRVAAMAALMVSVTQRKLDMHSPSRVFRELGGFVSEGMALGIGDNSGMVESAMQSLVSVPSVPSLSLSGVVGDVSASSGVQVQVINKSGVSVSDLIDARISENGLWSAVDLENGVVA